MMHEKFACCDRNPDFEVQLVRDYHHRIYNLALAYGGSQYTEVQVEVYFRLSMQTYLQFWLDITSRYFRWHWQSATVLAYWSGTNSIFERQVPKETFPNQLIDSPYMIGRSNQM